MKRKISCAILIVIIIILLIVGSIVFIPILAEETFGAASSKLNFWDRFSNSLFLLWSKSDLIIPVQTGGQEITLLIEPGSSITEISNQLELLGLVKNPRIFRMYLVWMGLDTTVQAGTYKLNPGMTSIEIAYALQDATPSEVEFNILPGWRMEEIAASLPTSGLAITPDEFINAVINPNVQLDSFPKGKSLEGFLFPGSYTLARDTSVNDLIKIVIKNFSLYLSNDLSERFTLQGLDMYQAVILASIVEREAIIADEQPLIASVFLNRLNSGMRLESDPTVQYAIGFDRINKTWWKNPLSSEDLSFDSPYNTYLYFGLPPAPISNPNLSALHAVAYPAKTSYYYFRAKCDGSGLHSFAETYEQHIQNGCQ
jgi:UPF0755 protein